MASFLSIGMVAQAGDPATLIKEKLVSQIKLTKAAADHSDIVTAGDVVVLHKDAVRRHRMHSQTPMATAFWLQLTRTAPRMQPSLS
jgi:hypothetical protein